jgi:hypothetical protein
MTHEVLRGLPLFSIHIKDKDRVYVFQRDSGATFHLYVKAKVSQSSHRKTPITECYPDPVISGLSSCLRDLFQPI